MSLPATTAANASATSRSLPARTAWLPLEVQYDLNSARGVFTREAIAAGPANIWRYARLLPIPGRLSFPTCP